MIFLIGLSDTLNRAGIIYGFNQFLKGTDL